MVDALPRCMPIEPAGTPAMQLGYVVKGTTASLQQVPIPTPLPGEALVKVLIAAVCNTDLEILKGYMGFSGVLGHEFVGVCERVPPGQEALLGKRVVGDINLPCGQQSGCGACSFGGIRARNHCGNRTVLGILNKDGTYAQYLSIPTSNLHLVPDTVSSENAAFVEPLAAACRILEQGVVSKGDRVAVIGDGKLGLLIAEVLGRHVSASGNLVIFGRHQRKMALVSTEANVRAELSADALPAFAKGFEVVVDATGSPAGLDLAQQLCVPMGKLVLKSTCAAGADFNTAPFVIDELQVIGSRCGPFGPALKLLEEGLDLTPLIDETLPLERAAEAIEKARTKGCMKVQIRVSTDDIEPARAAMR